MREKRKPMGQTNIINVIIVCIIIAPLMGGVTENLKIFLASVSTIPIVMLLLYILWLKFGYNGIHLNSINVFVMLTMILIYSAIPLFSIIWGTWIGWLTIFVHILTFVIGFIYREKLALSLNGINEEGKSTRPTFMLCYYLGIFILGIAGIISMRVTIATTGSPVIFFGFIHLLMYAIFAISPAFLIDPKRALELKVITQSHYDAHY